MDRFKSAVGATICRYDGESGKSNKVNVVAVGKNQAAGRAS